MLTMKAFFVNDRLAFGSAITSWEHVKNLRARGITHVINLRRHRSEFTKAFPSLWLAYGDDLKPRPARFYRRALLFYRRTMQMPKTKLFVMCHHGYQRSPSMAYFLLRAGGKSAEVAGEQIKLARRSARVVRAYRVSAENFLVGECKRHCARRVRSAVVAKWTDAGKSN
jgi:hypothetical protein